MFYWHGEIFDYGSNKIHGTRPAFPDLKETLDFYTIRLGFKVRGQFEDYAIVSRHDAEIHFWKGSDWQCAGWAWPAACRPWSAPAMRWWQAVDIAASYVYLVGRCMVESGGEPRHR